MGVVNSYYPNLIEGNATPPHDIRAAQRGNYSDAPAKHDLQQESLAHIAVQQWLQAQNPDLDTLYSPNFIQQIHQQFYQQVPDSLWTIKNTQGQELDKIVPGQWRSKHATIGQHLAPSPKHLNSLMTGFCENYHPQQLKGDRKLISIMAAHHRLTWIHPFTDGNGRVGRLFTDTALKSIGLDSCGAWCPSLGLARSASHYKSLLAAADSPRHGDYDGCGALTERHC